MLYAFAPAFGSAAFFAQGTAAAYLTIEILERPASEFGSREVKEEAERLAEASCTGGGCWFVDHVTGCYYDINGEFVAISGAAFAMDVLPAIAARRTR